MSLQQYLPASELKRRPRPKGDWYCSGTLWPHGEFSYGYAQSEGDDRRWHEHVLQVSEAALSSHCDGSGAAFAVDSFEEARGLLMWYEGGEAEGPPLYLSDTPNSHKHAVRGSGGITGYGQQMIKACGYLMGEKWPRHRKTLGTITLPEMSEQARREVVEQWPALTRELLQWVSRSLKRRGLPQVVCSVTEVQPKRLQGSGEGYLHWHLLWLNSPSPHGDWAIAPNDLRAWLCELLLRKIPSYQGGHINVNTKPAHGGIATYLAKYMSKGKQEIAEAMADWGEGICPKTWWNMTKPARDMVNAATFRGARVGAVLEECVELACASDPAESFDYLSPIVMEIGDTLRQVGWVGRFRPGLLPTVRAVLNCG